MSKVVAEEDSQHPEDIIARSSSYLESDRLDLAIKELNYLKAEDRQFLNTWLEKAHTHLSSTQAAEDIFKYLVKYIAN